MQENGRINGTEKAVIVGVALQKHAKWEVQENLAELKMLAEAADVEVIDLLTQDRVRVDPTYFIGKGKVEELKGLAKGQGAKTVIFDDDLSPAQVRNLEKATDAKIIDRSTLILDIFAKNARTRESKTQVELAQLRHLLPRLTRQWTHLSRQVGGIGTKGPGETQLETDRRLIRTRIEVLRKELRKIDQRRMTRRKSRRNAFKVSLVGYTNVGKSTIMNLLSGSEVLVKNQLFATLDSTIRRVELASNHEILLSDTVGFIRKLPHQLVESFKSTLDEVIDTDLLLHVVDISHPAYQEQINTVNEVINELDAGDHPTLMVFNKIDLLEEKGLLQSLRKQYPESVFISAARQIRTDHLKDKLVEFIEKSFVSGQIDIPMKDAGLVHRIYEMAVVTREEYLDTHVELEFRSTAAVHDKIVQMVR